MDDGSRFVAVRTKPLEMDVETIRHSDEEALREARSLGREEAERHRTQRELLFGAVARAVAAKGYGKMSVDDVVATSRMSRVTFYKHFGGKEECLLAAFDAVEALLASRLSEAVREEDSVVGRARAALSAVIEFFAAEPEAAYLATIGVRAAGAVGEQRYQKAIERLVRAVVASERLDPEAAAMAPLVIGAVARTIAAEVAAGRGEMLEQRLPELLFVALMPQLGAKSAEAEMRRWRIERGRISAKDGLTGGGYRLKIGSLEANGDGRAPEAPRADSPEAMVERLRERVGMSATEGSFASQVRATLEALVAELVESPEVSEMLVELRGGDATARELYRRELETAASALAAAAPGSEREPELTAATAKVVVNGIAVLVAREIDEGRGAKLLRLLPDLVFGALDPFLSAVAVEMEVQRSRAWVALR
jgi:AcrR family transcriptional regulator